jgi:hypothetical protein
MIALPIRGDGIDILWTTNFVLRHLPEVVKWHEPPDTTVPMTIPTF